MIPLRFKRRRTMASGGTYAESRCGMYRLYESALGGWSAGVHVEGVWRPLERREDGSVRWRRRRSAAIEAILRHQRQTTARKKPKKGRRKPAQVPGGPTQRSLFEPVSR